MKHQLKFYHLEYSVAAIKALIEKYQTLNNFVFAFYSESADKYFQLASFVRYTDASGNQQYSEPEILKPHGEHVFEVSSPVILSNNFITKADMEALISSAPKNLVFIPAIDSVGHVYYTVKAKGGLGSSNGDGDGYTNPSPPATMASA